MNDLECRLLPCPFCGGEVDWCDCGHCHQIQCKGCGMQLDNTIIGASAETLSEYREDIRKWWNTRATDSFKLLGYIEEVNMSYDRAAHIYIVDEEGFDGCTVPVFVKVNGE